MYPFKIALRTEMKEIEQLSIFEAIAGIHHLLIVNKEIKLLKMQAFTFILLLNDYL